MQLKTVICHLGKDCQTEECDNLHSWEKGFDYQLTRQKLERYVKCKEQKNESASKCPLGQKCPKQLWCTYLHPFEKINHACDNFEQCDDVDCRFLHQNNFAYFAQEEDTSKTGDAELSNEQRMQKVLYIKERGNQLYREGKYEEATEQYSQAIDLLPTDSILYSNRAQAYLKLRSKKIDLVFADCAKAIANNQLNLRAHFLQVIARAEQIRASPKEESCPDIDGLIWQLGQIEQQAKEVNNLVFANLSEVKERLHRFKRAVQLEAKELERRRFFDFMRRLTRESSLFKDIDKKALRENIEYFAQRKPVEAGSKQHMPEYLICCISCETFVNPVLVETGHTYEQQMLDAHFSRNGNFDPISRAQLKLAYIPNLHISQQISDIQAKMSSYATERVDDVNEIQFI